MPDPENSFIRPFPHPQPPQDVEEGNDEFLEYEPPTAAEEKEALRMLGLNIHYETFSEEEKATYLGSPERIAAFDTIESSTIPSKARADQKRGIVSEIIKKGRMNEMVLILLKGRSQACKQTWTS